MPLLRLKPFKPELPPKHLTADDEVFLCDLTGEVFTSYEAFYQRMILCNSLVWSCEISGKPNQTFKEAEESEKSIRKSLSAIPFSLKLAILYCVHHTRRSKIQDLTDEIYEYLKTRYQLDEKVEVKIKDKWTESIVSEIPYSVDLSLQNKLNCQKSALLNSGDEKLKAFNSILGSLKSKSPLENKELRTDTSELSYKVLVLNGPKKSETIVLKGKSIRRAKKGVFAKDKVKLFLKQSCRRTTTSSDDGYWVVEKKEVSKYGLGLSCIKPVTILSNKNKKPKTVKSFMDRPQDIALQQQKIEQKRIEMEQERERKKTELDALREQKLKEKEEEKALREQKLKEKEEEKARKKDEREKERELNLERKNLELDFVREFNKVREDLLLEDSKPLPSLAALESNLDKDLIGDSIMVVEFVNTFGSLLGFEQEFDGKVTLSWLEEALSEHDAEGNYFSIVKFLLHSYLCIDKEENNYKSDDDDDGSSSDNSTTPAQSNTQSNAPDFNDASKKASANASAAAAWSVLHQGMSLSDIAIEPFSLTEILRLHILSSGVRIGGIIDYNQWQRRGQYQLSDDPCVWFRHQEKYIMEKIMTSSVYDLSPAEKLKILVLLCNQTLMLSTVREYMEDSFDKMKSLRKDLREVQLEENQRRRKLQQAKWKKKVEERKKLKEEIKLKKERKSLEAQQQIQLQNENPGTPGVNVNAVDSPRSDGTLTPVLKTEASPNIQENGNGKEIDGLTDPKEQQEKELERKRKKEEKEQQIDDFHHEKFLFREKEILNEIAKYSAVISETPIGSDRFCRRYWNFHYVDGLLVENDEEAMFIASESDSDDSETENEGGNEMSEDEEVKIIEKEDNIPKKPPRIPKVTFEDIMKAKNEGIPLTRLILNRYNCSYNERSEEIVQKSPALKPLITNIVNGIDPRSHKKAEDKWYHVCSKEEYEAVVDSLNIRGIRENILNSGLLSAKTEIINSFEETSKLANKKLKNMNLKSEDGNDIDKSLFETMDDYIEGNLRDSLLEIEERLWLGNIGIIKCEDRLNWRTSIEQGMMKLIKYESPKKDTNAVSCGNDSNAEKSDTDVCVENGTDSSVENNDTQEMASPSHLKTEVKNDISSCVSQVSIPNSERQLAVKELADALLLIERGIEKRFLKAPLGEAEEIKVGKIKKVIESSNENQEDKKGSQCLSRWEESLGKCTSFAQIFIHLDTLDRSILWDKSIQNTKCRLCRRKGNEDEMLLCDGCDRGFHMSCLRPKLKTVPEGDWFCPDCRPIEIKRRNRKVSVQEEETEEEESDDETEEEDASSQSDSQSDGDEEEEDDEDDDSVNASEHGEHCTVCNEEGTLILCDECPRSYHIGCCYPRLKKVPRGNWCCQICTGLDLELPYKKRAITCERRKVRELKALNQTKKPQNRKARKQQQRGQADSKVKLTKDKKRNSSPIVNIKAAKKAKQDNDSSPLTTQRSSGMNRFHLKNCSALIGEVFELEEAQDFLVPVDSREVPDYYDFIDMPMDFGTIKRKLNTAKYVEIQEFLDDVNLVFQNCQTYNPPRSHVSRDGAKLKKFVTKRLEELGLS